jgi:ribosome recycling factor
VLEPEAMDKMVKDIEAKMNTAVEAAKQDFATIRTGRANPMLLEKLTVDYYGNQVPLMQIAGITAPEPRLLVVTPWDKGAMSAIERAIINSDIGLTPASDGTVIRLQVPYLTEERRNEYIKLLHRKTEEHRVVVRNIRRDANDKLKDLEKKHEISEDDQRRLQEKVQKVTDTHIELVEKASHSKEVELKEV